MDRTVWRWALVGVGFGLVTVGLVAGLVSRLVASETEHRVVGTVVLMDLADRNGWDEGERCQGRVVFSDVGERSRVRVRDDDGRLLASDRLGLGYAASMVCVFRWSVVIPDRDAYRFGLDGHGSLRVSRDRLVRDDWRVDLSLADG